MFLIPRFSPFQLYNGPCDLPPYDHSHTSCRGFGVRSFKVHKLLAPGISDIPMPDMGCHLSSWPTPLWPHLRHDREITYRDFVISTVNVHGTRETTIPNFPITPSCRAFPGGTRLLPRILSKWMVPIMSGFWDFRCPGSLDLENANFPMRQNADGA
jgi:hypothetical protein